MRTIVLLLLSVFSVVAYSQTDTDKQFIDASKLNIIGKALPTPNQYHRVDTVVYKGMSSSENQQARCSAGLGACRTL